MLGKLLRNKVSWSPQTIDEDQRRRSRIIPAAYAYDKDEISVKIPKLKKSQKDEDTIKKALLESEFLSQFFKESTDGRKLKDTIDCMYIRDVQFSEKIVTEGYFGDQMYISANGTFQVTKENEGVISTFTDNRVFGELALLYNAQRLATITSVTEGTIWVLDRDVFQKLVIQTNKEADDEMISFLKTVNKLNTVKTETLKHVASLLKYETFSAGVEIVKQGEKGNKFYIIKAGSVTVKKQEEGVVNILNRGEYFGVLALLNDTDTRQATVIADPPMVECLTLTRKQFKKHFGKVNDITDITLPPQPQLSLRNDFEFSEIMFDDLNKRGTIGIGGFGRVELVQYNKNPKLTFALKSMKKIQIVENRQQQHALDERNIMMGCASMFIVRLYRTYKDNKYVYFLMESCLGGDVWNIIKRQPNRRFTEEKATFITACVVEGLGYLHDRGIIYRDLKPENLMIDADGYIKLTDFGLAKILPPGEKTYTFTGTQEYLAPEILTGSGHSKPADYWTLGIFIYELLCGKTPFKTCDPSRKRLYDRIMHGIRKVEFPTFVSINGKNIVMNLCHYYTLERLGCQRNGINDVRNHKWFTNFNWAGMNEHTIASPFKPKLTSNTDTRYFDKFVDDFEIPPDEISGWDRDF